MRNKETGSENRASIFLKGMILVLALFIYSCGYRVVGSSFLPFESINIKHVKNETYEPRLEERLHLALSKEFINQGKISRSEIPSSIFTKRLYKYDVQNIISMTTTEEEKLPQRSRSKKRRRKSTKKRKRKSTKKRRRKPKKYF